MLPRDTQGGAWQGLDQRATERTPRVKWLVRDGRWLAFSPEVVARLRFARWRYERGDYQADDPNKRYRE